MANYKLVPFEPTPEMVEAAEEAYMPFGDMDLALRMAILVAPVVQGEQNQELVPAGKPDRITEQDVRDIATGYCHWRSVGFYNTWFSEKGRELLNKLNADREQVPTVAVPDGFREIVESVAHIGVDFGYGSFVLSREHIQKARELLAAAPSHSQQSTVQGEPVAVADALRQIAGWMDDGGPTYHEAELIGMAISGPVECSSAKQCTKAAKKAFLEAARIWEYMHQSQPAEQQSAPDVADYEQVLDDHRRLTRELDVLLNGEEGAAQQASLADLVAQLRTVVRNTGKPVLPEPDVAGLVEALEDIGASWHRAGTSLEKYLQARARNALAAHRKGVEK